MFDTMTLTKAVGGLCGTFLVSLLGGFVAEFIYHPAHGKGDDHHQAYTIAVESDGAAEEVVEVELSPLSTNNCFAPGHGIRIGCRARTSRVHPESEHGR